jgi:hypothetical protein
MMRPCEGVMHNGYLLVEEEEMDWYRELLNDPTPSVPELMRLPMFRFQVYFYTQRIAWGMEESTH